ncbi:acyl-CoA synthetase (AMP-forming)/AMP-acid ligase II [Brevibacterium sanguinis]|uniref:Acyl-CoA synthetase (AMP-forming)/AMP-acid ligase II n=2 Tax=Brevibacterium TaxID=1696 RepID=A0A366IPK8_9MICO|nr:MULTISPECIES: alpha/beta fold hydrolase [Brevibacterium]RBP67028.1 acyl-CoA synthetase (AMP-forming)/AMP-acid ligase II [Brevibacterium sanguinis]RBP73553.1 acyl-CoA synthetase (AMP-forming)/AMP-acid ligase II [Brevibacterium celere]
MSFPARPATIPPTLPEWDPAWSRIVETESSDGTHSFHVLDTLAALRAQGCEPTGTIVALHGNPTWSYLWRHLARATVEAAGRPGQRIWRVIAPDQLDMGFSERLEHETLPKPHGPEVRRISQRIDDLDAVVGTLLAEVDGGDRGSAGDHPIVTIGHDWGGVLSLGWAARSRDLVSAAISLNTAVHQPEDAPIPAPLRAALAGPMLPTATVLTDWFLRVTLRLGDLAPEVRDAFRMPYETRELRHGIGGFVADIPVDEKHPSHAELQRTGEDIAAFDRPALLVWGPKDPVFLERYLRDLRGRLPQADIHRFEQGSHLVSEDFDVAGVVVDWLTAQFPVAAPASPTESASRESTQPGQAPTASAAAGSTGPGADADATTANARPITAILDARRDDDAVASVDCSRTPVQQVSWRRLWHVTTSIAQGLRDLGVRPGDRVSMLVPPGNDLTAALYACLKIGAVAVVADAGLGPRGMTRAVTSADPQWIIGELPGLGLARAFDWPGRRISVRPLGPVRRRLLSVETSLTELARTEHRAEPPTPEPDADAAILFTSGSTGPAKGVRYTHGDISSLAAVLTRVFNVTEGTGLVAGFPPFALLGPAIGATSVTPDMSVTKPRTLTATAIADAIIAGEATMVFASPAAYRNVAATASALSAEQRAACAGVELVLSAGAPVPLDLMDAIAGVFPHAEIHSPYGMTEGLLLTDIDREGVRAAASATVRDATTAGTTPDRSTGPGIADPTSAPARRDLGVCVGRPIDGVELALAPIDASGTPTETLVRGAEAQGRLGELVVSAAHIKTGYDRLWRTTAQSARDDLDGRTWHRTNDIGHIDSAGRVWLEGRLQHVVTTPRGPVGPGALEALIDEDAQVTRSAVVGVGPTGTQALVAVLDAEGTELSPGLAPLDLSARLRARVAEVDGHDLSAVLVAPSFPTDIRHNSKIDRSRLAAWADHVLSGGSVRRHP